MFFEQRDNKINKEKEKLNANLIVDVQRKFL